MEINKIYQGDALDLIDLLDVSPKLMILSPPDLAETEYSLEEYKEFLKTIYTKCSYKLAKNGTLVSCTTDRKMKGIIYTKHIDIINSLSYMDLCNYKIWCKSLSINLFILNYAHMLCFRNKKNINNRIKDFMPDVWCLKNDKIKGYKNKDSFPTELVRRLVLNFTNKGDLVFDPFIGSGKVGKVCKDLSRNYIGFELDVANIELAYKLIER